MTRHDKINELVEYIYSNPDKNVSDTLAYFGEMWRVSSRTMDRYHAKAKELIAERYRAREEAVKRQMRKDGRDKVGKAIISSQEQEEILSSLIRGEAHEVKDSEGNIVELLVPSFSDRIRGMERLAKMRGSDAPVKSDITLKSIDDMTDAELEQRINEYSDA